MRGPVVQARKTPHPALVFHRKVAATPSSFLAPTTSLACLPPCSMTDFDSRDIVIVQNISVHVAAPTVKSAVTSTSNANIQREPFTFQQLAIHSVRPEYALRDLIDTFRRVGTSGTDCWTASSNLTSYVKFWPCMEFDCLRLFNSAQKFDKVCISCRQGIPI